MPIRSDFDVVIIGSGAGGSPIAHELVLAGKDVLIFEKGPMLQPQFQSPDQLSAFKRDELYSTGPEKRIQLDGVVNKGSVLLAAEGHLFA